MEVNSSPGLEGIETATGVDVAGEIIEYIESNVAHDHGDLVQPPSAPVADRDGARSDDDE